MKELAPHPGNVTPEQVLGSQLAAAVGEDGSMLEMIALVIKPGYWPTITLRKRLRPPELEAVVKIFQRHHIVGVEVRSETLSSAPQEADKGDLEPGMVPRGWLKQAGELLSQ